MATKQGGARELRMDAKERGERGKMEKNETEEKEFDFCKPTLHHLSVCKNETEEKECAWQKQRTSALS
jgi:hypothetical protein